MLMAPISRGRREPTRSNHVRYVLVTVAAFVVAAAAILAIWFWLGRSVPIQSEIKGKLDCLSYAPSTASQHPLVSPDYTVPLEVIEKDLMALRPLTDCIRTYSSYGIQAEVLPIAARLGFQVMVGIWIGAEDKRNRIEIDAALKVTEKHPGAVRAIIVGNEVLLRKEMSGERLASVIRSVKARTSHKVAYADMIDFWMRNPMVTEAVDKILLHVLPYWDDPVAPSVEDVQDRVRMVVGAARAAFPGKDLEIGEIGWPSAGRTRAHAVPTRVNQARFIRDFVAQAGALGLHYNIIEALDQSWKRLPEGTVGGYWGIIDGDRKTKFPFAGPVSEWPDWKDAATFSTLVSALFLLLALVCKRRPGLMPALGIALSGAATGTLLWMLADQIGAMAIGLPGLAWGGYLISITILGGLFLAAQMAGLPGPWDRPPAPLSAVLAACRQRRLTPDDVLGLLRWAILLPAAIVAVSQALDGRYRDFHTLAFLLPALALLLLAWRGKAAASRTSEEGWLCLMIALSGPAAVDVPGNWEAMAWAGTCLLLALPGLPAIRAEWRRLHRAVAPVGQG